MHQSSFSNLGRAKLPKIIYYGLAIFFFAPIFGTGFAFFWAFKFCGALGSPPIESKSFL